MKNPTLLGNEIHRLGWHRALSVAACIFVNAAVCAPATADVLLESNFTSNSWYADWQHNETRASLKSEPPNTNRIDASSTTAGFVPLDGAALQITIPKGQNAGSVLSFYPKTVLGKDPSELYLRYFLRFGSDFNQAQNGKLPGFAGTYGIAGWGGFPSNGSNGWSARGKFGEPCENGKITLASYVYHADMPGQYGDGFVWTRGCDNGLNKNQWYAIDYYVKVNTPGSSDGIVRGWIDGQPAMEKTGLRFDDTGNFQIERVWMNVYHGGKIVAPQNMHLFIDNVTVSQEPIGQGSSPPEPAIPNAPAEVKVE